MRKLALPVLPLLAIALACTRPATVVVSSHLSQGAQVGVIMLRDSSIGGDEDCKDSGKTVGDIFVQVFGTGDRLKATSLARPVSSTVELSDAAAVAYGKTMGVPYVLNGEVIELYHVAPMTFRPERAGISIRILRVEDSALIASYSDRQVSGTNFTTPEKMVKKMAEHVLKQL